MPQPLQDKSLGNRRIFISPCPLISFGGSYLEILARDKKGSIFYANEINRLPPADRTTGIEVSGTAGSQINQIRCVGARGVPSTPSLEEQPLCCTHGLFRSGKMLPTLSPHLEGSQLSPPSQLRSLCQQGQGQVHSPGDSPSVVVLPD